MRSLLNLIPLIFLAAVCYSAYSFYTAEEGILIWIPACLASSGAFITSIAWRITPAGPLRKLTGICFAVCLLFGIWLCLSAESIREIWMPSCIVVIISIHLSLYALAVNSFLFSEARRIILLIPIVLSVIGITGLFLWNGTLALSGIGLVAAVIFALLATIFGIEKKKTAVRPEDN